jgi:amino acid adenylation domain-containing protein
MALTYAQLWERSGWLAGELAGLGVAPGALVAVDLDRSIDLVVALLGIVRAGAAYLPLDDRAPTERLATILEEARTALVISSAKGAGARPGERLPASVQRLGVPESAPPDGRVGKVAVDADAPVYVAYTSGSTGRPKGVVVPHRAVLRLVTAPRFCTLEVGERVANASNPAFDATTFELWSTLTAGATVVVFPSVADLTVERWSRLVRAESIDSMFLTTSLFHMVARERPDAFRDLRTVIVGGEQMDVAATRRVLAAGPPRRLVNGYGPTETTTFASYYDCTAASLAGLDAVPIGFALQETRLHVLDQRLRPVPEGEPGELCIGGPGVAIGYLRRPELTTERFVPEPGGAPGSLMYRTGDVVRRLPDGALVLLGRRDRQVKLRGFRVELEEIERSVLATGLAESAVVEKVGDGPAASLVGFVATPAGSADLAAAIEVQLATRLPGYMIPRRWIVLSRMPLGPTGKVDREQLLRRVSPRGGDGGGGGARDALTEGVGRIWCAILGLGAVDGASNFIESGGNSILAAQLASRISTELAIPVEPADVLLATSFEEFTSQIRLGPRQRMATSARHAEEPSSIRFV